MEQFVYIYRPPRSTFIEDATETEKEIVRDHLEYLSGLLSRGRLILTGPCLDAAFGIVVFEAEDAAKAREVMENDPAIRAEVFQADLHPFRLSLLRGLRAPRKQNEGEEAPKE